MSAGSTSLPQPWLSVRSKRGEKYTSQCYVGPGDTSAEALGTSLVNSPDSCHAARQVLEGEHMQDFVEHRRMELPPFKTRDLTISHPIG